MKDLGKYGVYALAALVVGLGATWYFSDSGSTTWQATSTQGTTSEGNVVSPAKKTKTTEVPTYQEEGRAPAVEDKSAVESKSSANEEKEACPLGNPEIDAELEAKLEAAEDEYERQQILDEWQQGTDINGKTFDDEDETVEEESTEDQAFDKFQEPVVGC
jgi:hypothetical protein